MTNNQNHPNRKKNPYSLISIKLLNDENLSFGCKGLLSYLLSLDKDEEINTVEIVKKQNISKNALNKLINEAIKKGYMTQEKTKNEKGHFIVSYYFTDGEIL